MDVQTLSNLFATTFSPDPNVRKSAELQIRKVGGQEGMITALLQIIGADAVDITTRQACSVYVKNRVQKSYVVPEGTRLRPDQAPIAESDRNALKASILPLLVTTPTKSISIQLSSTLKTLIAHDFPERWPTLSDNIKALLSSTNAQEVIAGCTAMLEVIRVFRFRSGTEHNHLPEIVAQTFPQLASIASRLLETPPTSSSQDVPTILHLILKTYKHSIVLRLSPHQQSSESLVPWGRLLLQVVGMQIPKEIVPEDEEAREKCEWWKAKKWAFAVLGRLFHRYGNPSQLPSPLKKDYSVFAEHFVTAFAPEIFKMYLQQVELLISGQTWLSLKSQYYIFQYFTECVKPLSTWALLKPHFQTLVSSFVFPQLSFNAMKQELWNADPVDYVRTTIDEYEDFSAPVSAATTFVFSLVNNRTKSTFMPILGFINSVLESNAAPPQKFGALKMTAALGSFIMRHPQVRHNMEQFMVRHVLPEFSSTHPYMRAIACDVLGTIEKIGMEWSNEENLAVASQAVARAMDDPELPVRVQAALALTEMVSTHDSVEKAVGTQVGKVIQDLLKLSDETDLDILNNCMETMVERYHAELLPVAAQLTARLCDTYMRLMREAVANDNVEADDLDAAMAAIEATGDESDDKTFAAMGVAKTLSTIVSSVDTSPEILSQVEEIIIPIIKYTLENKILDLFDNAYDLIDSLTFNLRRISPNMWPIFEETYKLFKSDAIDFLDEMLPSLDNFLSYGSDIIKTNPNYKLMLLDIYTTTMGSDHLGENDRVNACKLIESFLLNLRGEVNEALAPIISTAVGHLGKTETRSLKLANLEVLINAVLYNPSAALHLMETTQPNSSRAFFDQWFASIKAESGLPRVHDKKLSIMTICALLELDVAAIPLPLQEGWTGMVAACLHIFGDLPRAVEARKALEDALKDGDEEEDEVDETEVLDLEEDNDEADVWDEDSKYMELLAQEGARLREKSEKLANGDSDAESSTDDDSIDEELGYISPLENVDVYVSFKHALTAFQMKNTPAYQASTTALNVEQQTMLMEIMAIAEKSETASA